MELLKPGQHGFEELEVLIRFFYGLLKKIRQCYVMLCYTILYNTKLVAANAETQTGIHYTLPSLKLLISLHITVFKIIDILAHYRPLKL